MRLQPRLAQRSFALAAFGALSVAASGCNEAQAGAGRDVAVVEQRLDLEDLGAAADALRQQCDLVCPGEKNSNNVTVEGIARGNAAISGVASVDSFFASVINFQSSATGVAGGIKAQLDAIRGDFGIAANANLAAELKAKFDANLDGAVTLKAEPARCEADVEATLQAQARCDAEFSPGSAMVQCEGSCEVEASAEVECSANAELQCTFVPPNLECSGMCKGSCTAEVTAEAGCSGTCRGECSGNCSAYVDGEGGQAECAGKCDGMCTGTCEAELAVAAECEGKCEGECTVTKPEGGCEGGIRAECKANAGAKVECDGKCVGKFEPPMAKAECQASAKAEAKINVQCTPPQVSIDYKLRAAAGAEILARAKFEAALKTLVKTRLPALKAELARGQSVAEAGADLIASAGGSLKAGLETAADADVGLKVKVGLLCAAAELDEVEAVIDGSAAKLKTQVDAATSVMGMLNV
jgi:hypothetical protein